MPNTPTSPDWEESVASAPTGSLHGGEPHTLDVNLKFERDRLSDCANPIRAFKLPPWWVRKPDESFAHNEDALRIAESVWECIVAEVCGDGSDGEQPSYVSFSTSIGNAAAARHMARLQKIWLAILAISEHCPTQASVPPMAPPAEPPPLPDLLQEGPARQSGHAAATPLQQAAMTAPRKMFIPFMVPPAEPPPPELLKNCSMKLLTPAAVPAMAPPSAAQPLESLQQQQASTAMFKPPCAPWKHSGRAITTASKPSSTSSASESVGGPVPPSEPPPMKLLKDANLAANFHTAPWRDPLRKKQRCV